jgi:hypothetical protein
VTDTDEREQERHGERLPESGGLHYQQAHRAPAETRSALDRAASEPDQTQSAEDHGGPDPEDESWLQDQGYPKLGKGMQSQVTQMEHGPYAGGTQQGNADTRERTGTTKDAGRESVG